MDECKPLARAVVEESASASAADGETEPDDEDEAAGVVMVEPRVLPRRVRDDGTATRGAHPRGDAAVSPAREVFSEVVIRRGRGRSRMGGETVAEAEEAILPNAIPLRFVCPQGFSSEPKLKLRPAMRQGVSRRRVSASAQRPSAPI